MKSRAIVFTGPNQVTFQEYEIPEPAEGQILTQTLVTGVSTGTETRVLSGKQGEFPLIPGYENVGRIVQAGPGVDLSEGAVVFVGGTGDPGPYNKCWGGQVEYALADAAAVVPVPDGVDVADAIYAKTGGIALHGMKRAKVGSDDTVAVVGQGLIGHLAALCCKARGAKVIAVDTMPERLEASKAAGVDHVVNAAEEDVQARVRELSGGGVTVAVDVTGVASTVDGTCRLVHDRPWEPPYPAHPRVVILGSYTDPICLEYEPSLFANEPDIITSRDTMREDLVDMMALIAERKVRFDAIDAHEFAFTEAESAYKKLVGREIQRALYRWAD